MKTLCTLAIGVVLILAFGCEQKKPAPAPETTSTDSAKATESADHEHSDAPHGGTITDWGGGAYHVEFIVDHDAKSATVYVLGEDATTAAPIKAEKILVTIKEPSFQVELTPDPLPGEAEGTSSRFVGQHDNFGNVQEFAGTISGEVDGTPYAGDFAEVAAEEGPAE